MATGQVVRQGSGQELLNDMSVRDMYLGEAST
jgi:ABC-type lipopolysaccharide export system ATPase subunit